MPAFKRILYVDGDCHARERMQGLLAPHEVDLAGSAEEARARVHGRSYDLYVICGDAADASGIALCEWLQRIDGRTPIVFCSSNPTARAQKAAVAAGALRYLVKPIDPVLLRSTLGLLLQLAELESVRALVLEQEAIVDELKQQARQACMAAATARDQARAAGEYLLRARAYRVFRAAGGNRANFERLYPVARAHGQQP